VNRYVLKNAVSGELVIKHLNREQESDQSTWV
jgi:peptide chain release factor subunit 1